MKKMILFSMKAAELDNILGKVKKNCTYFLIVVELSNIFDKIYDKNLEK